MGQAAEHAAWMFAISLRRCMRGHAAPRRFSTTSRPDLTYLTHLTYLTYLTHLTDLTLYHPRPWSHLTTSNPPPGASRAAWPARLARIPCRFPWRPAVRFSASSNSCSG